MAFKSKTPSKGLRQKTPLQTKKPLQSKAGFKAKPAAPAALPSPLDQKKTLQRQTIRALERAKKAALEAGVDLSDWESDFIDGVTERVKTYGRAFADPDKGAMNGTLSLLQGQKLREIRKKVKDKANRETPESSDEA
ncbi:hypothetical protein PQU92_09525 [Asticcacaulis sp. BYS171W]|uniref:Uncharacterized protein n=1 Tax=Asticcacaulis aquaticus TaxID=2984212 RepID=A0ABT5HTW8_9CAUL|nr:hypothetical protein [Asticcacaulis aquaticus]MDC7683515.1 hypothetical protein [Asticcacaulis aquaticus]